MYSECGWRSSPYYDLDVNDLTVEEVIGRLRNVNDLTVEEVIGRLRNVEQRKKNTTSAVVKEGRLLLMEEEEWLARLKLCDNTGER